MKRLFLWGLSLFTDGAKRSRRIGTVPGQRLVIAIILAIAFPALAEMEHHPASHAKPEGTVPDLRTKHSEVVESGLSPSSGHKMETMEAKAGGYDVGAEAMTHKDYQDMMKAMKMEPMKPAPKTTHHLAVTINKGGEKVRDAKVEAKVVAPDGTEVTKMLSYNPDMMFQYVGHFHMARKGKYQVLITFEIGKEKHQGKVYFEVK